MAEPPLTWSLRQFSTTNNQNAADCVNEENSLGSFSSHSNNENGHESHIESENRADEVPSCKTWSAVSVWDDLQSVVVIFVLLMGTLLYKELLHVDLNMRKTSCLRWRRGHCLHHSASRNNRRHLHS